MKVSFIGLGNMGRPITQHLLNAGHQVTVNDLFEANAADLIAAGATWAKTPSDCVEGCDIAFTSLPGPEEINAVVLDEPDFYYSMPKGSIYVDLSTNSPSLIRKIHEEFSDNDIAVLDAPVSGNVTGAQAGNLTIMVGGEHAAFVQAKPVLEAFGERIIYCGPTGSGMVCKLCNNMLSLGIGLLNAEALTLGVKAGVDLKTLVDVISSSSGANRHMDQDHHKQLFHGGFRPGFSVLLAEKDLRLALELGRENKVPLALHSLVEQEHINALAHGYGSPDCDIVATLQEDRAKVHLRLPQD